MGQVVQGIAILVDKIGLGLSKLIQVDPSWSKFGQVRSIKARGIQVGQGLTKFSEIGLGFFRFHRFCDFLLRYRVFIATYLNSFSVSMNFCKFFNFRVFQLFSPFLCFLFPRFKSGHKIELTIKKILL